MRTFIFSACVFTAACSGQGLDSPTSPTAATAALVQTEVPGGTQLPFRGSYLGETSGTVNCPPTCPPTLLTVSGSHSGEATHLGRFTATSVDVVNLASTASTGTFTFTAANGDQLMTETTGSEDEFIPPNISRVTLTATIVGGTGRFAAATGTFTLRFTGTIDFAWNVVSNRIAGWIHQPEVRWR
jgi:hypothetical protein